MQPGWGRALRSVDAPTAPTPQGGAWDSESLTGEQTVAAGCEAGLCVVSLSGYDRENPPIYRVPARYSLYMISLHLPTTTWAKYSYARFIGEETEFVESGF